MKNLFKTKSRRGKIASQLIIVTITVLSLIAIDKTVHGQERTVEDRTITTTTQSQTPLLNLSQRALKNKSKKAAKNGNYLQALEYASFGLLTQKKVKRKRTEELAEIVARLYPLAIEKWQNELSSLGKGIQSINSPDRRVLIRKKQVQLHQESLNLHNLMMKVPDKHLPKFEVDMLDLEAERDVFRVLLEQELDTASNWHFEQALQKLLEENSKREYREVHKHLTKSKVYRPRKFPGIDSLLRESKKLGTVTFKITTRISSEQREKYGPLARMALDDFQVFMRRQYEHNPFINAVFSGEDNADFTVLVNMDRLEHAWIKPKPASQKISKETKSDEGVVKNLLATVQKHEQRMNVTAYLSMTIRDSKGAVVVTKTSTGRHLWTHTYAKLLSGNQNALKGSKWERLVKKKPVPMASKTEVAVNALEQALVPLKLELDRFINEQLSN